MAAIPEPDSTSTVAQIYRHYERLAGGHRDHLGASVIGHECARYVWLSWRWVARERFDGRMLRLFEAGKAFEPRIVAELRAIGVEVWDADEFGQQHRVSAIGGHFGGSLDAVALGLPEAPKTPHVLEFKTHSQKSFDELLKKKVREAKPQHFAQMQVYMGLMGLDRAMYLAENKNTSEVYAERIDFDPVEFERLMARARAIIEATTPPERLSADPAWFACKFCAFHGHCHGQAMPEVNCRTCAHSTPVTTGDSGHWRCELGQVTLDPLTEREGCNGHRIIPVLLERVAQQSDAVEEADGNLAVTYTLPTGASFVNGYAASTPGAFDSREIVAAHAGSMLVDPVVQQVKAEVPGARLVAVEGAA